MEKSPTCCFYNSTYQNIRQQPLSLACIDFDHTIDRYRSMMFLHMDLDINTIGQHEVQKPSRIPILSMLCFENHYMIHPYAFDVLFETVSYLYSTDGNGRSNALVLQRRAVKVLTQTWTLCLKCIKEIQKLDSEQLWSESKQMIYLLLLPFVQSNRWCIACNCILSVIGNSVARPNIVIPSLAILLQAHLRCHGGIKYSSGARFKEKAAVLDTLCQISKL